MFLKKYQDDVYGKCQDNITIDQVDGGNTSLQTGKWKYSTGKIHVPNVLNNTASNAYMHLPAPGN